LDFDIPFQRAILRLLLTNLRFATHYGTLIKEEYFETQFLKTIFSLGLNYILQYEKEVDSSEMTTLVSDYTVTRGWSKDIYREIKDEIKQVFMTPIKNEQFVTDRFITFCRKQEMKNALIKSVGILEEDANYDQILKMIDQAMSVGCDGSDSLTYKDLLNLPELFRQKYNPTKLVKTGYPTYDKCFMGGLAAGEIHVIQAPPKCFTGDTLVQLLDGSEIPISDFEFREPTWVMSYDTTTNKIIPALARFGGKKLSGNVVEVVLDNGYKVKCTSDHRWLMSDGNYTEAGRLQPDDSLMAVYWTHTKGDRPRVKATKEGRGNMLQDLVAEHYHQRSIGSGEEVHHRDSNPYNNNPSNLEILSKEDHSRIHGYNEERLKKMWEQAAVAKAKPEFKEKMKIILTERNRTDKMRASSVLRAQHMRGLKKKHHEERLVSQNHKVVSVTKVGREIEVFDIEVPGPNNFSIGTGLGTSRNGRSVRSGVFVHNSGKSTLACNIGTNALLYNKTVYHISLEIKSVDVMAKYAVRMTNLTYDELVSCSDVEYIERIAKFNQYKPRLFVNYWTELTVSAQVIRGWVSRTRSQTGFNPDLIIVDYDDCLLPVRGSRDDMYNDAGEVYSDLIGLADYFKCPVVTFAQPRREAWEKVNNDELIHSYDLAHSARKAHKTYSISSLNFKEGSNEGIFYIDLARRGESGVKIPIVRDLSRGIIRERANIHAVGG